MATKTKKSNSNASTRNSKGKNTGKTTKKTTGKVTTSKKTATTPPKSTKTTAKPTTKTTEKSTLVFLNTATNTTQVYRKTTDKVGDVLVNQAGVKFKITGEKLSAPKGFDDGKTKIRMLEVTPEKKTGAKPFKILDQELKTYRDKKILVRKPK